VSADFGTLVVIVLAGLAGPLLGLVGHRFVPVVIGEIAAGILAGPAVLEGFKPHEGTISFLALTGFAMLMLTVGMHLPLRDREMTSSLGTGAVLAALVGALAIPGGLIAAAIAGTGHAAIYAVILASGSAAVLLPAVQELGLGGARVMAVMAQVTIADFVTVLSVPIVLQPRRVGHALLGGALVVVGVVLLYGLARLLAERKLIRRARRLSRQRGWVLDLRLSLLVLFFLAWIAQEGGTSVLVAGFGAGLTVALLGGPKRLSTQVRGIADGFFIPLYFVVLGAELDVGGLFSEPKLLLLAGALAALNVAIHLAAAAAARRPLSSGLVATAQLGVPAAVATLGLAEHVISSTVATSIVAAALLSLAACTVGVDLLAGQTQAGASG
jgi:Kef-type K+ transport system membrane component KefB